MTRRGCFEGCVLLVVGAIAVAIAAPMYMTIKEDDPRNTLRSILQNAYKECAYHMARTDEGLPVRDLQLTELAKNSYWEVFDLKTGGQLDLNAGCNETKVLAKPLAAHYGKLAYGLDLIEGYKSCITRDGEKRDDWSCE